MVARRRSQRARTSTRTTAKKVFFKAGVSRLGTPVKQVIFEKGDTIQDLLDKANVSLTSGEAVNDEYGNEVSLEDEVKEQEYVITGNYQNGC